MIWCQMVKTWGEKVKGRVPLKVKELYERVVRFGICGKHEFKPASASRRRHGLVTIPAGALRMRFTEDYQVSHLSATVPYPPP